MHLGCGAEVAPMWLKRCWCQPEHLQACKASSGHASQVNATVACRCTLIGRQAAGTGHHHCQDTDRSLQPTDASGLCMAAHAEQLNAWHLTIAGKKPTISVLTRPGCGQCMDHRWRGVSFSCGCMSAAAPMTTIMLTPLNLCPSWTSTSARCAPSDHAPQLHALLVAGFNTGSHRHTMAWAAGESPLDP